MARSRPGRQKTIDLHVPSQLGSERSAMDLVQGVAKRMGFPPDRIEDIKTAVSEATTNAIEHGHGGDKTHKVIVDLYTQDGSLEINVRDRSTIPFPLEAAPEGPPDLEAKLAGLSNTRGWGMFLIRTLVDEVEFSSTGQGNVVRMVVHLDPPSSSAGEGVADSKGPEAKNAE